MNNIPSSLGKYEIQDTIGEGSMGMVHRGYDASLGRTVAIKTIHEHMLRSHGDDLRERFKREAQAAAKCLHPNIVTIFDFGEQDGIPYIAMEFVEGQELKSYLREMEFLSVDTTTQYALQMLDALKYLHDFGIVHRDIKPANIMLTDAGVIKLTDFGIAHVNASDLTGTGLIGTPNYMAPEQIQGITPDHRTDYYALGIVLYEIVTGIKPFAGKEPMVTINNVINNEPENPSDIKPDIPAIFSQVLLKAMCKNPDERYQSADEFKIAIQQSNPDLDRTTIAASIPRSNATPGSTQQTAASDKTDSSSTSWHSSTLTMLTEQLIKHLGPIAPIVVKRVAKDVTKIDDLYARLAEHLPEGADKQAFLRQRFSSSTLNDASLSGLQEHTEVSISDLVVTIPEDAILAIEGELIKLMGPIAKQLIKRGLKKCNSTQDLCLYLADNLTNSKERDSFLSKVKHLN